MTTTTQTLSPEQIAQRLADAGIAPKDFWQTAAGGDLIPLSASIRCRIASDHGSAPNTPARNFAGRSPIAIAFSIKCKK